MVTVWRLKMLTVFILLSIDSLLFKHTFNFISNENIQSVVNSEPPKFLHNKLNYYIDETASQDKKLKSGSNLAVVDGDEVDRVNSDDYSKLSDRDMYYKHKFENMKSPNSSTHSVGSLSLYNILSSQLTPGQKSHKIHEYPSQMTKEVHLTQSYKSDDHHIAQTKIQKLQTSHSNLNTFRPSKHGEKGHSVLSNIPKLEGFMTKGNKSLLEKGFRTDYSFDSPELLQRRKYITAALEGASELQRDVARVSLNANLLERGKHQHEKIQSYCKSGKMSASLPENFMELNTLFKHLLYDDSKKIVFCYVPKNSCSSMKRMMLILNGIIPANSSQGSRPLESTLRLVHSFHNLSREGAIYRLENYFKFSILRNPMERLLSAYRNKLEKPLDYKRVKFFPESLKALILRLMNKDAFQEWVELKNYSNDIHPSFSDTLDYMTKFSLSTYNEHFLPFLNLCHPCAVKYDLILNLKSINYDIFALMEYMRIPLQYFPVVKSSGTRDLLEEYYKQVSQKLKTRVFDKFAKELEFYYNIYPE